MSICFSDIEDFQTMFSLAEKPKVRDSKQLNCIFIEYAILLH